MSRSHRARGEIRDTQVPAEHREYPAGCTRQPQRDRERIHEPCAGDWISFNERARVYECVCAKCGESHREATPRCVRGCYQRGADNTSNSRSPL